jgi:hypothetical protein
VFGSTGYGGDGGFGGNAKSGSHAYGKAFSGDSTAKPIAISGDTGYSGNATSNPWAKAFSGDSKSGSYAHSGDADKAVSKAFNSGCRKYCDDHHKDGYSMVPFPKWEHSDFFNGKELDALAGSPRSSVVSTRWVSDSARPGLCCNSCVRARLSDLLERE